MLSFSPSKAFLELIFLVSSLKIFLSALKGCLKRSENVSLKMEHVKLSGGYSDLGALHRALTNQESIFNMFLRF